VEELKEDGRLIAIVEGTDTGDPFPLPISPRLVVASVLLSLGFRPMFTSVSSLTELVLKSDRRVLEMNLGSG
jgi:hypothetical protein